LENEWIKAEKGKKPMFPVWLSPTQVRIIPVAREHLPYCEELLGELEKENIRVDLDDEEGTMQKKIRNAEKEWIPYIVVIGDKEISEDTISVRIRSEGVQENMRKKDLVDRIKKEIGKKPFKKLSLPNKLSKRPRFR
jgi:threonyl-tRNA synthetase